MEQLTVSEALEQGFTHAMYPEESCGIIKLTKLTKQDIEHAEEFHKGYVLCEKEPTKYQISDTKIEELIAEDIDCQEEFFSEDGLSGPALEGCDELLKSLTDKINENLSKKNFYFETSIKLVP